MLLSASQHIFAGLKKIRDQKLSSGLKSGQLNLASLFVCRGTSAVEFVTAHLRGFEEDSRPEVNLTSSTNPVISMFVCIVQALVSRRTLSRDKCC